MSFSFSIRAKSKPDLMAEFDAKFDEVEAAQPVHSRDRKACKAALAAVADQINVALAADEELSASCNGWLSWRAADEFAGACVGATVSVVKAG